MKKIILLSMVLIFTISISQVQAQGAQLKINGRDDIPSVQKGDKVSVTWSGLPANNKCYLSSQLLPQGISVEQRYFLGQSGEASFTADMPSFIFTSQDMDWESGQWFTVYLLCPPYFSTNSPTANASALVFNEVNKIEITSPQENVTLIAGKKMDIKWKSDTKKLKKVGISLAPAEPYIIKGDEIVNEPEWSRRFMYLKEELKNKNKLSWKVPKNIIPGLYTISVGELGGQGEGSVRVTIVNSK